MKLQYRVNFCWKITVWAVIDVLSRSIPFYLADPYLFIEVWIDSKRGYGSTQDDGPHCMKNLLIGYDATMA